MKDYWHRADYIERCPLIPAAYKAVLRAIKTGALAPAKRFHCVDCGRNAQCWDHRDYREPLAVEPVCLSCNRRRGPALPYLDVPPLSKNAKRPYRGEHAMRLFDLQGEGAR